MYSWLVRLLVCADIRKFPDLIHRRSRLNHLTPATVIGSLTLQKYLELYCPGHMYVAAPEIDAANAEMPSTGPSSLYRSDAATRSSANAAGATGYLAHECLAYREDHR